MNTRIKPPETLPALSKVDLIVQLLQPKNVEQCRRDVEEAIQWIANLPPRVAPVTVKKQLDRVTAKVKAARKSDGPRLPRLADGDERQRRTAAPAHRQA